MPLDDRTVAIYSALDSATLLALLPALRCEAERTKEETDTFERVRQALPAQLPVAEGVGETTGPREWRLGEIREPHELLRRARDRTASDGELGKVLDRLDRYRSDLVERERWIRNDLVRRGLFPEYPFWGER
jgi:hypothetical protein